ncbi:MAG: gamma-glutamylcyclotransferase family protein [Tumebacillaceae bacterium]
MALYFAYASCMNQQSLAKSGVHATFLGTATLQDYRLAFSRYSRKSRGGVADVVRETGSTVEGVLYRVTDFRALDKREGAPRTYRRRKVRVFFHEGQDWLTAWTYEVVHKTGDYRPSPRYARTIWTGAVVLPAPYRDWLKKRLHIVTPPLLDNSLQETKLSA